jgi:signal peptidase II
MKNRILLVAGINIASVGLDQYTKWLAVEKLQGRHPAVHTYVGDTIRILYAENTGAFLGLGDTLPPSIRSTLFISVSIAIGLVVTWMLWTRRGMSNWEVSAYALLLSGAIGNLIDRVLNGYVVDFMNLGIGGLRTGIFNVADVAIVAAVVMLLLESLRQQREEKKNEARPESGLAE